MNRTLSSPASVPATISHDHVAATTWDVLVVGAGPAGALAALLAARAGYRVLIVDKNRFPRSKVCGGCIGAVAANVLSEIGLASLLDAHGAIRVTEYELRSGTDILRLPMRNMVSMSRHRLDASLLGKAIDAGSQFLDGSTVTVAENGPDSRQVTVTRQGQERHCRAKVILLANGLGGVACLSGSAERDRNGRNDRIGLSATFATSCSLPARLTMAYGTDGYVGLVLDESGNLNIAAAVNRVSIAQDGGPRAVVADILGECRVQDRLVAELPEAWHGTRPLWYLPKRIASHRIFAIGDAAGYVEPFTGEGIGWALASAVRVQSYVSLIVECGKPSPPSAWQDHQTSQLADSWTRSHRAWMRQEQGLCRLLCRLGYYPRVGRPLLKLACRMPVVADVVRRRLDDRGLPSFMLYSQPPLATRR